MKLLEERILRDGIVKSSEILKVDSFINHQIDPVLLKEMAGEWKRLYSACQVDEILTIEASGIGVACVTALAFGVPALFAKKVRTSNLSGDVYTARVQSFTAGREYDIMVARQYLHEGEHILIIDDFLARGAAMRGLVSLCGQAGAIVEGAGVCIEKAFQNGGNDLRAEGLRIEALAKIESMSVENGIKFC